MSSLDALAARHGVSPDAARHLLDALARGGGYAAQFNHPELGGMGQWSSGGMLMIGDMFNNGLKARVAALCDDLVPLVADLPRQQTGGWGFGGAWWPEELGQPSSSGAQNDARYAVFPQTRRLAIQSGGRTTVYDTGDHLIGGVSQQQSDWRSLTFTSQHGPVSVDDLPVIDGTAPPDSGMPASHAAPVEAPAATPVVPSSPAGAPVPGGGDVLATLERLAELHRKGILTEAEFAAKKSELLARL
ncbi:SHOCT domain-containing protein [Methylobacterium oryzihabitans]|uniref:SHOCT domain-containing protein n=1 Tax=Methylobacterium oryzihabitans TaxID=2499852 RepID=A0A437NT22_9HYPH|nr:SHOCT domain-containing protein [Methylobacterium oryzihabitans]RVU13179.1 SHOCT domain-containing protein [Methylobacterium oryzihabitans]